MAKTKKETLRLATLKFKTMKRIKQCYLYRVIGSFFKHDCDDNRKVISKSYFKDGQTGIIFSLGKEFECCKCGKQWSR